MRTDKKSIIHQDSINRIEYMEGLYDKGLKVIKDAEENPAAFLDFQSEIDELEEYMGESWKDDFSLDEQGKLPADLKRGVLSEDGLFNLLEENRETLDILREKYKDDPGVSAKIRFLNYEAFKKDRLLNNWKVFGVEIYENGKLAYSFGDTNTNVHPIYSVTKSILAIAVGIALDRNLIDLEKNILYYVPPKYTSGLSKEQRKKWEKVTLSKLMTMSVPGFPFRAPDDNYMDFSFSLKDFRPD